MCFGLENDFEPSAVSHRTERGASSAAGQYVPEIISGVGNSRGYWLVLDWPLVAQRVARASVIRKALSVGAPEGCQPSGPP